MVHYFSQQGYDILLDVNSGLVHVVDDIVIKIIKEINQGIEEGEYSSSCPEICISKLKEKVQKNNPGINETDLEEAIAEVKQLIENNSLYTKDIYQDAHNFVSNANPVLKAMCLSVAHDCNLACKYCFAEGGEYKGKRELMSFEVGKKALDYLVKSSGTRRNLEVDFFGGEPLMNFDVVKKLVAYGRSLEKDHNKNFRFTLTTNAMLLNDDVTEFLNKEMSNVVLSLDGRKEVNDKMRVTPDGHGSYDIIVPKIKEFIKKRGEKDYYVRGTFTRNNLDFASDIQEYLDLGFDKLSIEPVVTTADYGIHEEDIPKICEEYERLAKLYLDKYDEGKPFTFFHFMIDLDEGPCIIKRLKGCGSGAEYVAVSPSGDIYPCHQFVGMKEFAIGNVDEGITNKEIPQKFQESCVYTKDKCDSCFAKFYCSGGCPANSWNFSKDINKVYEIGCKMQQKRVECAIMIKAHLAERGYDE